MKRSESRPEWSDPHLLSFVTNTSGGYLAVHADLAGITMLIDELEILREQLEQNDCPHTHLFSPEAAGDELTSTKIADQNDENIVICHVKIYGWNEEWAVRHGLKPATS
jgi:hypothetical protein